MLKIIVIGILYNLLLQSNAAAEPMVKMQMCSDIISTGITESLNQIGPSEMEEDVGDFERTRYRFWFRDWETYNVIPISSVQFKSSKRCEILSDNSCETIFDVVLEYEEKSYNQNRKKKSNSYLSLNTRITGTLYFHFDEEKITFQWQDCDVLLRQYDNNGSQKDRPNSRDMSIVRKRLCNISRKIINKLDKNWKDFFIIDPSGDTKLLFKSVTKSNPDCVEFSFNLNVRNSERSCEQTHGAMPGNGISIAKDYFTVTFPSEDTKRDLNKQLEKTYPNLSPEELRQLIPDVYETEKTVLKCNVEELTINAENEMMALTVMLEGFSPKSDKSSFQVKFKATLKMEFTVNKNRVMLQFKSTGDQVVLSWKSNIGKSGEPDYGNVHTFTENFTSETLVSTLNDLRLSLGIPYWNLPSTLSVKPQSVQIQM